LRHDTAFSLDGFLSTLLTLFVSLLEAEPDQTARIFSRVTR